MDGNLGSSLSRLYFLLLIIFWNPRLTGSTHIITRFQMHMSRFTQILLPHIRACNFQLIFHKVSTGVGKNPGMNNGDQRFHRADSPFQFLHWQSRQHLLHLSPTYLRPLLHSLILTRVQVGCLLGITTITLAQLLLG